MNSECIAISLIAFALLTVASSARGQGIAANSVVTESEEDRLAQEVDDPTAILTQLKLQDLYMPRNFQTPAQTNQVDLKVVLPLVACNSDIGIALMYHEACMKESFD